jgi:hypothetical protein
LSGVRAGGSRSGQISVLDDDRSRFDLGDAQK